MTLSAQATVDVISQFGANNKDTGSAEVQVALLTKRIKGLEPHFKANPKDRHSRHGMKKLVAQRRRLLNYLMRVDIERYRTVIAELGLRR
jgi:small subunit ribosomal protein S15